MKGNIIYYMAHELKKNVLLYTYIYGLKNGGCNHYSSLRCQNCTCLMILYKDGSDTNFSCCSFFLFAEKDLSC